MRGTKLLIACAALLVACAGRAHGGIMINIVQQTNGTVTVNFSGTVSVVSMAAVSNSQHYNRGLNSRNIYTAQSAYNVWTVTGSGSPPNLGSMTVDFTNASGAGDFGFGRWQSSPGIFVPAVFLPTTVGNGGSYTVSNFTGTWSGRTLSSLGLTAMSRPISYLGGQVTLDIYENTGLGQERPDPVPNVPEPSSLAIFGIGALAMAGMGLRRKRGENATP